MATKEDRDRVLDDDAAALDPARDELALTAVHEAIEEWRRRGVHADVGRAGSDARLDPGDGQMPSHPPGPMAHRSLGSPARGTSSTVGPA